MPFITQNKTNWRFLLIVVILAFLVCGVILAWGLIIEKQQIKMPLIAIIKKNITSQQIIEKCEEENKFMQGVRSSPDCLGGKDYTCIDGWKDTYYYDKRLTSTTTFPTAFLYNLPKELKEELEKATIAVYGYSCSCKTPLSYRILVEDKLQNVTCVKFYKFIEDYNSSCNNCLLEWSTGCC